VNELYDEKIDIVRWNDDIAKFIAESLSPAKVVSVEVDESSKSAFVVVPDNQLSLAIGKSGQNVRLAARLTGWRIDIRSELQVARAALSAEPDAEAEVDADDAMVEPVEEVDSAVESAVVAVDENSEQDAASAEVDDTATGDGDSEVVTEESSAEELSAEEPSAVAEEAAEDETA
jgi:N utilization substance protein A